MGAAVVWFLWPLLVPVMLIVGLIMFWIYVLPVMERRHLKMLVVLILGLALFIFSWIAQPHGCSSTASNTECNAVQKRVEGFVGGFMSQRATGWRYHDSGVGAGILWLLTMVAISSRSIGLTRKLEMSLLVSTSCPS